MVKEKLFVCRECGYVFPKELSELIENEVQVYCEMCGTPFSLEGVKFKLSAGKPQGKPYQQYSRELISERSKSKLSKAIQAINKFAYLPILIFSGIIIGFLFQIFIYPTNWENILIKNLSLGIIGILIVIYDVNHISPRIKNEEYDKILLDALCYGILGSIIYGVGVILLIKGILILIYGIINPKKTSHKVYNFGLSLKNSLNEFSAKAGIIIIFIVLYMISIREINIDFIYQAINYIGQSIGSLDPWLIFTIKSVILAAFCLFPIVILIIDARRKSKLKAKERLDFRDAFGTFILGILGTIFFSIGIFILLKAVLMFFLVAGKPSEPLEVQEPFEARKMKVPRYRVDLGPQKVPPTQSYVLLDEERGLPEKKVKKIVEEKSKEKEKAKLEKKGEFIEKKEIAQIKSSLKEKESTKIELRLHDSLLPVKDEKDKKTVKEYFSKIFNLISKDIRQKIIELDIPKKDKKEILKELAFLTEREQIKYLESLASLYRELPSKLITRVRKLPNVKPQHYDKIIDQLKYMDAEEQINFIQFLEKNA